MRKFLFLSAAVLGTLLFVGGIQPVHAGGHAGHHHPEAHAFSPFEKRGLPVHCALLGHSIDKPCPHILKSTGRVNEKNEYLAADCAGPSGIPGSLGFDENTPAAMISLSTDLPGSVLSVDGRQAHFSSLIPHSIEHPPRFA